MMKNKRDSLPILLVGDEEETSIMAYLELGRLFVLTKANVTIGALVITNSSDDNQIEIENLSIIPEYQKRGYGKYLLQYICQKYSGKTIILGTDEVSGNIQFYQQAGFEIYKRRKNYFIEHYKRPLYEKGLQLIDKIYLRKKC
ncbi:acetyltransferase [Lactococcus fujiensis JCM 16395]|uniref:Acetyltransferase n=1 Tax=Lactococcus fujiensis JCM 16395 TaxID=1291764 RepID=A0A2A5RP88_9LACT|nr:acetyltransferase [Lactococcus fujiensis JCM 16395]